jgi:hypothetical protein
MKIGPLIIIARERLLIPKGERAEFTITYKDTPLNFAVEFQTDVEYGDKSGVLWDNLSGVIRLRFRTKNMLSVLTPGFHQLGTISDGS